MFSSKIFTIVIITIALSFNAFAQNDIYLSKFKSLAEEGYYRSSESKLIELQGLCDRVLSSDENNSAAVYYSAYSSYRLSNLIFKSKNNKKYDMYLDKALADAEKISGDKIYGAEAKILSAAVYMMKIAVNQDEAPALSMKIQNLLGQALAQESGNPRAHLISAIMKLNAPPQFGGSIKEAEKEFAAAAELFAEQDKNSEVVWGELENETWLGIVYMKQGKTKKAREKFNAVLQKAPEFAWVKYSLLPNLNDSSEQTVQVNSADLKITITGFANDKGFVRVGLADSEQSYESGKFFRSKKEKIVNGKAVIIFKDIPFGEYAVKSFHDENNNEKLDTGMFGIPTEDYGFSNNASGTFGPAEYEDAKFIFSGENSEITFGMQ